jgi:hypothetical protein
MAWLINETIALTLTATSLPFSIQFVLHVGDSLCRHRSSSSFYCNAIHIGSSRHGEAVKGCPTAIAFQLDIRKGAQTVLVYQ